MTKNKDKRADLVAPSAEQSVKMRVEGSAVPKFLSEDSVYPPTPVPGELEQSEEVLTAVADAQQVTVAPKKHEIEIEIENQATASDDSPEDFQKDLLYELTAIRVALQQLVREAQLQNRISLRDDLEAIQLSPDKQKALIERLLSFGA